MTIAIEAMRRDDWSRVRAIYAEGLATGLAAFMKTPPRWPAWDARALPFSRFVARSPTAIVGWAALSRAADT